MKKIVFFLLVFFIKQAYAQDDNLLDLLGEDEQETQYISNAFKSSRVINGQSMEMLGEGVLDFRILHRFGQVSGGLNELFGLDQASMRMGLDYGITKNLMIGIGRSTHKKEVDGFLKYRLLWQSEGKKKMPFSLLLVAGYAVNTLSIPFNPIYEATFTRRSAYYTQLILGRKFSEKLTLQISPTWVHTNFIADSDMPNERLAVGFGGRYKFSKRVAFVWDYFYVVNRAANESTNNSLSVGLDIDTGGHVFQLHFSNSKGLNERAFINDTNGNWTKNEFQFGFNLSRVFQVKKRKV